MRIVTRETLIHATAPGVMLLPTDTVYGLHARVDDGEAIQTLKTIKERSDERFFITLISQWEHLLASNIIIEDRHRILLERLRPGPYTVILADKQGLTRSFRWPAKASLCKLIDTHGPLYSTSANRHGQQVAASPNTLDEKLGFVVDYGIDEGVLHSSASTIIQIVR